MENRFHPYEKAQVCKLRAQNSEKRYWSKYEALAGTLRAKYPLIHGYVPYPSYLDFDHPRFNFANSFVPNPTARKRSHLSKPWFSYWFVGLFWAALRPDKTYAKKPKIFAASDSEDVQKAFSFSLNVAFPKVDGLPSVDAEYFLPTQCRLLSKRMGLSR